MKVFYTIALSAPCCAAWLSPTYAQTKCKYAKEKYDAFTKKTARTATMAIGPGLGGWEVILQEMGGKYYFGMRMIMNGTVAYKFEKGRKILYKLADDNLVEVTASNTYEPIPLRMMDMPFSQWIVIEEVPRSVYEKLAASPIVAIRSNITGQEFGVADIKDRQTKKIMETAACMIANN